MRLAGSDHAVAVVADEPAPLRGGRWLDEIHIGKIDDETVGIGQPQQPESRALLQVDDEARALRIADQAHVPDGIGENRARQRRPERE